jgi:hypothetical protein
LAQVKALMKRVAQLEKENCMLRERIAQHVAPLSGVSSLHGAAGEAAATGEAGTVEPASEAAEGEEGGEEAAAYAAEAMEAELEFQTKQGDWR